MARVRSLLARFGLRPHHGEDPDEREPGPRRDPTGPPAPVHDPTGVPAPVHDPTGVPAPAHDPTRTEPVPVPAHDPTRTEPVPVRVPTRTEPVPAETGTDREGDTVDDWGKDSFPASDPPPGP